MQKEADGHTKLCNNAIMQKWQILQNCIIAQKNKLKQACFRLKIEATLRLFTLYLLHFEKLNNWNIDSYNK